VGVDVGRASQKGVAARSGAKKLSALADRSVTLLRLCRRLFNAKVTRAWLINLERRISKRGVWAKGGLPNARRKLSPGSLKLSQKGLTDEEAGAFLAGINPDTMTEWRATRSFPE
jgi:hypothetical protein